MPRTNRPRSRPLARCPPRADRATWGGEAQRGGRGRPEGTGQHATHPATCRIRWVGRAGRSGEERLGCLLHLNGLFHCRRRLGQQDRQHGLTASQSRTRTGRIAGPSHRGGTARRRALVWSAESASRLQLGYLPHSPPANVIPTNVKTDPSTLRPPRHAGDGWYPRLALLARRQVVDTGLRRHDGVGIGGESIIRIPGIS
jgi:hypothetical protein